MICLLRWSGPESACGVVYRSDSVFKILIIIYYKRRDGTILLILEQCELQCRPDIIFAPVYFLLFHKWIIIYELFSTLLKFFSLGEYRVKKRENFLLGMFLQ